MNQENRVYQQIASMITRNRKVEEIINILNLNKNILSDSMINLLILKAIKKKRLDDLLYPLLDSMKEPNTVKKSDVSILFYLMSQRKDKDIIRLIKEYNFDVNASDINGTSLIDNAIRSLNMWGEYHLRNESVNRVISFLMEHPDLKAPEKETNQETLILSAFRHRLDKDHLLKIIDMTDNVNVLQDGSKNMVLKTAMLPEGHVEILEALIQKGVYLDISSSLTGKFKDSAIGALTEELYYNLNVKVAKANYPDPENIQEINKFASGIIDMAHHLVNHPAYQITDYDIKRINRLLNFPYEQKMVQDIKNRYQELLKKIMMVL